MNMRIGQGVDAHAFGAGDAITLGGVHIPFKRGIVADSDGDVLTHAICDALCGACALGDLGAHFSDVEPNADSRRLLRELRDKLPSRARVVNLDSTIVAQEPKIAPFVGEMRRLIAQDLRADIECVSVKATTFDHLGFLGRGEGIAALAVVLVASD